MIVEDLGRIPMSPYLASTLTRAAGYSEAQGHPQVSVEHLLLALTEDPEATVVMKASGIDIDRLTSDVSSYLGRVEDRAPPGTTAVAVSAELRKILEAAAAAASHGRRREINGAIVLAAIVGEGKSAAAQMLRAQGLTFEEAIRALQKAQADAAAAKPATTEDILASARERVQTRSSTPPQAPEPQRSVEHESAATEVRDEPAPAPQTYSPPVSTEPNWQPAPPLQSTRPEGVGSAYEPAARPAMPPQDYSGAQLAPQRWAPPPQPAPAAVEGGGPRPPNRAPPPLPPASVPGAGYPPPPPGAPVPRAPMPPRSDATGSPGRMPTNAARPSPPWSQQAGAQAPRRPGANIQAGQLVENIPRRMRVAIPVIVEARIARASVKSLADGLQGPGPAHRYDVMVSKAMSVRLRSPTGGFFIEGASPETQWIDNVLGAVADDFASWRWSVTPKERGKKRLQLIVSARTVGADGLTAETALPDQVVEVKVGINYAKSAVHWGGWLAAAIIGGVLARFGEDAYAMGRALIEKFGSEGL